VTTSYKVGSLFENKGRVLIGKRQSNVVRLVPLQRNSTLARVCVYYKIIESIYRHELPKVLVFHRIYQYPFCRQDILGRPVFLYPVFDAMSLSNRESLNNMVKLKWSVRWQSRSFYSL
jgi:hypothetical protein